MQQQRPCSTSKLLQNYFQFLSLKKKKSLIPNQNEQIIIKQSSHLKKDCETSKRCNAKFANISSSTIPPTKFEDPTEIIYLL